MDPLTLVVGAALLLSTSSARSCRVATPWLMPLTTTRKRWPDTDPRSVWLANLDTQAREVIECAGLPPNVAFAQAALESAFGASMPTNPWGLRGVGDAGSHSIATTEYFSPDVATKLKDQKFAKFSSLDQAAAGYARFLQGKSYRPGRVYIESDPGSWLLWLWGMGYATAPDYARTAQNISVRVALQRNDASLAIPWSSTHDKIANMLSDKAAGKERRALTTKLLAPPGV